MDDARGRRGRRDEPLPTVRDERMTSRRRLTARREREREREQTSACGGRREQREEKKKKRAGVPTHRFGYHDMPRAWMRASGRNAQRR